VQEHVRALRDTLIGVFGLNLLGKKCDKERQKDIEAGSDPDMPKFVPGSFLFGNPEVIKSFLTKLQRREKEESVEDDEAMAFDKFSTQLLNQLKTGLSDLPADMIPLLTSDLTDLERNSYWRSDEVKEMLTALGVKPRSSSDAVPHIPGKPKALENAPPGMLSDSELEAAGERPQGRKRVVLESELEKFRQALKETPDG